MCHHVKVVAGDGEFLAGLHGFGSSLEAGGGYGDELAYGYQHTALADDVDVAVGSFGRQDEGKRLAILGDFEGCEVLVYAGIGIAKLEACHELQVFACEGNLFSEFCGDGSQSLGIAAGRSDAGHLGCADGKCGLALDDVVGNVGGGVFEFGDVHIVEAELAGTCGFGHNECDGVAAVCGEVFFAYHFVLCESYGMDEVEVVTLDGDFLSGPYGFCGNLLDDDGFGVCYGSFGFEGFVSTCDQLDDSGFRTVFGHGDADFAGYAAGNHFDVGDGVNTGDDDLCHLVEVGTEEAELSASHDGRRTENVQMNTLLILVGIVVFVATAGRAHACKDQEHECEKAVDELFHGDVNG